MRKRNPLVHLLPILIFASLSACSNPEPALPTLDTGEISQLGSNCQDIYTRMIAAWDSRDAGNFRQVYTDDIVHHDGAPYSTGIDSLMNMGIDMFSSFTRWQMLAGDTYISRDQCLGTWLNWGIFGLTEDNPGLEYDLLDIRDGKVSYWRLFYQQQFFEALSMSEKAETELLTLFADTWSSGDADAVYGLYSRSKLVEDSLFNIYLKKISGIKDYISAFLARSPGATWQLVEPFAEAEVKQALVNGKMVDMPTASEGGVFAITVADAQGNPCQIRTVAILTYDDLGKVKNQKMYYDADSLIACGWAE